MLNEHNYNPDVLTCIANLSSDEVFTPPKIANAVLDLLPESIWSNRETTFLDPFCKSGIFLREIARRLDDGLKDNIPDRQERINHIMTRQVFGIAITELTSLLSRRSLYCSKTANGEYAVSTAFNNADGHIKFGKIKHTWKGGKCTFCGASKKTYARNDALESHAYQFIHTKTPEEIFKMKFDVIVGNPPYQLSTAGGENGAQAKPLYHFFVQQAIKLNPRYLTMIIPSRWFAGGWGLDDFRRSMMNDAHIKYLHDFPNASDCFPGVEIKGGVCYFLRDKAFSGSTNFITHENNEITSSMERPLREPNCEIVIRYNDSIPIFRKVKKLSEQTFNDIVSTKKPFGFTTNFKGRPKPFVNSVKIYGNRRIEYVTRSEINRRLDSVDKHKLIIPKAVGSGNSQTDHIKPLYCEPNSCCTETYLLVGPFNSNQECENAMSYIGTKFFHFLVTLQKNTQDCMKKVYSFVPIQDFSQSWNDEKLYKKYGLTEDEIAFIESMIRPMD